MGKFWSSSNEFLRLEVLINIFKRSDLYTNGLYQSMYEGALFWC